MFRRYKRRHTNIVFVIFRLILSVVIFAALLGGIYSAYKYFSGMEALNLNPKSIANVVLGFMSQQKLSQNLPKQISDKILGPETAPATKHSGGVKFLFRFALLSDSHSDNLNFKKALDQIKKEYEDIRFIIGLGDYTDIGTYAELKKAKNELDNAGVRYFVTPGDHDLWDSRNKQSLPSNDGKSSAPTHNFSQVFGPTYQSFIHENFLFLILNNSDNYLGLGDDQKNWLSEQLASNKDVLGTFVFLHEPFFHPSSDHFMGRVEDRLKAEAQNLTRQFAERKVKKVFAGDTHFFSEYSEPQTGLPMVAVGAITSQRNLQLPRFTIVSVFDDGSTRIEDVEVR